MENNFLKRHYLQILLTFSVLINLLFYIAEIHPIIINKLHRERFFSVNAKVPYEKKVVQAALEMNLSSRVLMNFDEHTTFFNELRRLVNRHQDNAAKEYNYLKAYLLYGIIEYGIQRHAPLILDKISDLVHPYINDDGSTTFKINKVDQAVFGLSFIDAEQLTHDTRYRKAINQIYNFLKENLNQKHHIILYRKDDHHQLVDALGMVCPFLIRYGTVYQDTAALQVANREIIYYIKYGLESKTHFPFHGIQLDNKLTLGPANWGRGIGWYAIALAFSIHYTSPKNNSDHQLFENEMTILHHQLKNLQNNNYWGQFITGDPQDPIDTSTTALLLLSFNLAGMEQFSKNQLETIFIKHTTTDGYITNTSGDTFDINRYATMFGKSELTQGLLLSLLSYTSD